MSKKWGRAGFVVGVSACYVSQEKLTVPISLKHYVRLISLTPIKNVKLRT